MRRATPRRLRASAPPEDLWMLGSGLFLLLILLVATVVLETAVVSIASWLRTGNAIFPLLLGLGFVGVYLRRNASSASRGVRIAFWGAFTAGLLLSLPGSLPLLTASIGLAVAGAEGVKVAFRLATFLGFTSLPPGAFVYLQAAGILSFGLAWRSLKPRLFGLEIIPFAALTVLAAILLATPFVAGPGQFDAYLILLGLVAWTLLMSSACLIAGLWSLIARGVTLSH